MTRGLFDDLAGPLELRRQTAPAPAERGELRVFSVLELECVDHRLGTHAWVQVDEVYARSLADAGEVELEARGWRAAEWAHGPAYVVARSGGSRFAILDPLRGSPADVPA